MFLAFRFTNLIHRLTQLDTENAGYAEKLLQYSTVGEYCKRLAGVIQVSVQCNIDSTVNKILCIRVEPHTSVLCCPFVAFAEKSVCFIYFLMNALVRLLQLRALLFEVFEIH